MGLGSTPKWFHISDDEDIIWESRPHPISMGTRMPIGIGVALVGVLLATWSATGGIDTLTLFGVAVALVGAAIALACYLAWTNTRYVITSGELYKKHGVISRNVIQFRLDRIQNTSLRQTMLGRVLGYGDLTVYTAGSGDPELTFERVPQPERASSLLSDELEETVRNEPAV